jgi:hypothetical protein
MSLLAAEIKSLKDVVSSTENMEKQYSEVIAGRRKQVPIHSIWNQNQYQL